MIRYDYPDIIDEPRNSQTAVSIVSINVEVNRDQSRKERFIELEILKI